MVVDIVVKRDRGYNVIVKGKVGPYSGDNNLRPEFRELVRWARKNKISTRCWLFYELDGPETPPNQRRWEACLEIKDVLGKKEDELPQGVSFRKIPSQLVASVMFDPDKFSSRLVYHGLECWLEWRAKNRFRCLKLETNTH